TTTDDRSINMAVPPCASRVPPDGLISPTGRPTYVLVVCCTSLCLTNARQTQSPASQRSGCQRSRPDPIEDGQQFIKLRGTEDPVRTSWRDVGKRRFVEQRRAHDAMFRQV